MTNSASVILATYNEAENVGPMIEAVSTLLSGRDFEIIVVDDDLPDFTWRRVEAAALTNPRVRLIRRQNERGLTSAYQAGIRAATKDVLVWLDCDFQHPVSLMPVLLQMIDGGLDAALTSRFLPSVESGREESRQLVRRLQVVSTLLLNRLGTLLVDRRITDWTSGYLAIRRSVLDGYSLIGGHGEYYIHLMHHVAAGGYRFKEIPYTVGVREKGMAKTSASLSQFVRYGVKYVMIFLQAAWHRRAVSASQN